MRPRRRRLLGAGGAAAARGAAARRFKLVTPGIRPAGSARDDQARIITPEAAVANGADYLVIGRPITQAADPLAALAAINARRSGGTRMKITMIGTGYVGLVTGTCLAEVGNDVLCLDVDARKIDILNAGGVPIHEPGLEAMIRRNVAAGRLAFTTDVDAAVAHGALQFIAVGTPPDEDGSADMQYVLAAARNIGRRMTGLQDRRRQVDGAGRHRRPRARGDRRGARGARRRASPFAVVSNPGVPEGGRGGRGLHAARPRRRSAPTTSARSPRCARSTRRSSATTSGCW